MKPILPGGRGAAVEDVQRRLLSLGHDLGPTGVDGVFLGRTREAVVSFQRQELLSEDGIVGPETWAALVDATFTLGDRMLYLRVPYFHGRDVRVLQEALNALGFSCGAPDSIFGPFTERAVREFQRNSGQPADGIVGQETVRALEHLRHVWEGKGDVTLGAATVAAARAAAVLGERSIAFRATGALAGEVAARSVNLALATDPAARVFLADDGAAGADIVLWLRPAGDAPDAAVPVVGLDIDDTAILALRFRTAIEARKGPGTAIALEMPAVSEGEREAQQLAVRLLDSLCAALA